MLTNSDIDIRMVGNEFPDRSFGESFCAGIDAQWIESSGENLFSCNRIPVFPVAQNQSPLKCAYPAGSYHQKCTRA